MFISNHSFLFSFAGESLKPVNMTNVSASHDQTEDPNGHESENQRFVETQDPTGMESQNKINTQSSTQTSSSVIVQPSQLPLVPSSSSRAKVKHMQRIDYMTPATSVETGLNNSEYNLTFKHRILMQKKNQLLTSTEQDQNCTQIVFQAISLQSITNN